MIEFCDLQTCRRKYLLAYFGEGWQQDNCGGCDVCLTPREEFDATVIAQKILSAIVRTGERFGIAHLSQVLRGANTKRVRELRHDRLSVYSIVDDFSDSEIKEVAALLQAGNLLRKDSYASLSLTPAGRAFLKNREKLTLTRAKRAKPAPLATPDSDPGKVWRRRDVPPSLVDKQSDTAFDAALFEKLRTLRRGLAEERNVPPYVIFGDMTLRQMAAYLPQSREGLSHISGVGAAKLERWGEAFLEVIRSYADEQGLAERPVPDTRRSREPQGSKVSRKGSTYTTTKQLLEQGRSITEVAAERGLSLRTVVSHIEKLVTDGEAVDLGSLLPASDRLETIQHALDRSGTTALAPIKAMLGKDYTYEEIRLVRAFMCQTQ